MSEFQTHPVPANFKDAHINAEKYQAMYKRSIEDPDEIAVREAKATSAIIRGVPWACFMLKVASL